ncbi:hypothetical protein LOAG_07413 [Loa loa]|uniref:Uncharacterized protein n=1 Tax=Loa loa TaxID=7209 RepID=A0A1S0TVN2_LOALO|nr:hypothetical protein LOAG_07413 [Loa loa]EFO21080.1 hypothetical protein LOAG_07413 [Loa loa]
MNKRTNKQTIITTTTATNNEAPKYNELTIKNFPPPHYLAYVIHRSYQFLDPRIYQIK